jgi:hypothetical protein
MKIYAHSQSDALKAAGASLNRLVTSRDTGSRYSNGSNGVAAVQMRADDGNRTRVFSLGS